MRLRAYAGWIAVAVLGACAAADGWCWFETARVNRAIVDGSIVGQEHSRLCSRARISSRSAATTNRR